MKLLFLILLFPFLCFSQEPQDTIMPVIKIDTIVPVGVDVKVYGNNGWYEKFYSTHTYMRYMRNDEFMWMQEYDENSNLISSEQFIILTSRYEAPYRITKVKSYKGQVFEMHFNMHKIVVYHDYLNGTQDRRLGNIYY
jgi:hypothetical protein